MASAFGQATALLLLSTFKASENQVRPALELNTRGG